MKRSDCDDDDQCYDLFAENMTVIDEKYIGEEYHTLIHYHLIDIMVKWMKIFDINVMMM